MTQVELLAPAGSSEALDAAIGEGADAVYLGLKNFNARMRSANFTYSQFEGALRSLHRMKKKLYVTVNTVFQQREADRVYQLLKYLAGLGPDGILVQDFGIITMVRENFPSLKLHASTQMNIASARGVNLLSRHGFSRVVLARELSLEEIREIRANTNMELEVFVHGALCISVSGLCLFSSYLGGKSANRGMCTQACRRFYKANYGKNFDDGEKGGYYFSPADLELIEEIPALIEAGVSSFKIEGRMKSAEYVGAVVSAYRLLIDSLGAGEENLRRAMTEAKGILKNDFARPKTKYLINQAVDIPPNAGIDWLNPKQSGGTGIYLGTLLRVKGRGAEKRGLIPKGMIALSVGDSIRLHKADDSDRISHKINAVENGPDSGKWISIPETFGPADSVYLIQTKAMTRRYAPVIRDERKSREPGRDKAPLPESLHVNEAKTKEIENRGGQKVKEKIGGKNQPDFPGGYYAMVSRIEDLYILQSVRPVKAILPYSKALAGRLDKERNLPFPARDIILWLDPFFPQAKETELAEEISTLIEIGYKSFIVNNLGHFSLFRQKQVRQKQVHQKQVKQKQEPTLIAGPWLYTFNSWASDFIARCGAAFCITPFENNRQNVEKTFSIEKNLPNEKLKPFGVHRPIHRSQVFIPVFSRPSLFRIRQDITSFYRFETFTGSKNEAFHLAPGSEGSTVLHIEPFSIVDKIPFLKEAGFSRFILDFSLRPLKKAEYRDIMEAVNRSLPIPGASRFNWKNGFFQEA